jgi:micrococcal nuclease
MYEYRATLVRLIDADTFRMDIDLGMYVHNMANVRLVGVYAPELSTPEGKMARDTVAEWWGGSIDPTDPVILRTEKDRKSFDRWLGTLYLHDENLNLAIVDRLTAAGLVGGSGA